MAEAACSQRSHALLAVEPAPMTATDSHRALLRTTLRERRLALLPQARIAAAEALAARLRQLPELAGAGRVAGYWAVRGEMPLHALFSPAPGFVYGLPCLAPGKQLQFAPWRPGDPLVQNRYGIPEPDLAPEARWLPADLDIVLVPLLGFDRHGTRLGAGGGYYDRSFAFLRSVVRPARPLLIGVGYDFQEVDVLIPERWDVAMDLVVTDARTLRCR